MLNHGADALEDEPTYHASPHNTTTQSSTETKLGRRRNFGPFRPRFLSAEPAHVLQFV